MDNNWYVITGGPSVGKTTLLEELNVRGYKTVAEAARVVIDEGLVIGMTVEQIRADEKNFQDQVLCKKLEIEEMLKPGLITFLDRGVHDTLAYRRLHNIKLTSHDKQAVQKTKYKKVFLLDPLDIFEVDYARTETEDEALKLQELLYDAYVEYGMVPIVVPALSIEDRLEFVLDNI